MKKLFKYFISILFSVLNYNRKSKVIFYHDIHLSTPLFKHSTSIDLFAKHISLIRAKGFEIVQEITDCNNQIKIQFDDGYKGIYDCLPYLISENIAIEIFIITDFIGRENYLSETQLKELSENSLIKISSHTKSHSELSQLNDIDLINELQESKFKLEKLLNKSIDSICYPIGKFSKLVEDKCKLAGYENLYSSIPSPVDKVVLKHSIGRYLVQDFNTYELNNTLIGGYDFMKNNTIKKHIKI